MSKYSNFHKHLSVLAALPSVQATKQTLTSDEANRMKAIITETLKAAELEADKALLARIKAGVEYVVITPDSVALCVELNEALSKKGDKTIYRPERGYESGKVTDMGVYREDFERFGFKELLDGLPGTFAEARKTFTKATVSLRTACYMNAGKPPYRSRLSGTMNEAVFKLTKADGKVTVPEAWETRTSGNVYAILLDNVQAAADATTKVIEQRAAEKKAAETLKQAAIAAKKAEREKIKAEKKTEVKTQKAVKKTAKAK